MSPFDLLVLVAVVGYYILSFNVSADMPTKKETSDINDTGSLDNTKCEISEQNEGTIKWSPLDPEDYRKFNFGQYALIVLNQPILMEPEMVINLWNNAVVRMTVDGGTNRWYDFCDKLDINQSSMNIHPDLVSGDFDSMSSVIMNCIKANNCEIVRTPDQNQTDFIKALLIILERNLNINSVIVIIENSGRLDHIMSNLNAHYFFEKETIDKRINLFSLASDSITWLLRSGYHSISIPQRLLNKNNWCGLLPVGKSSIVSSKGLKYNICKDELKFGGLISSSNTYNGEEEVCIETSHSIFWSMGLGLSVD